MIKRRKMHKEKKMPRSSSPWEEIRKVTEKVGSEGEAVTAAEDSLLFQASKKNSGTDAWGGPQTGRRKRQEKDGHGGGEKKRNGDV